MADEALSLTVEGTQVLGLLKSSAVWEIVVPVDIINKV